MKVPFLSQPRQDKSKEDENVIRISQETLQHLQDIESHVSKTLQMIRSLLEEPHSNPNFLMLKEIELSLTQAMSPINITKAKQAQRALTHAITDP